MDVFLVFPFGFGQNGSNFSTMGGIDVGYNLHIFTFFFYSLELSFPWSPATGGLNNMSLEIRGGERNPPSQVRRGMSEVFRANVRTTD